MSDEYMTPEQAAEYLGLGVGTLQNYRTKGAQAKGQGPKFEKIPAIIRYRKGDLDEWDNNIRAKRGGWGGRRRGGRQ